jgi:hypothetical protein
MRHQPNLILFLKLNLMKQRSVLITDVAIVLTTEIATKDNLEHLMQSIK